MTLNTKFLATAVGSVPFRDPEQALDVFWEHLQEAPTWPQLPQTGLFERMVAQYSEGIPCVQVNHEKGQIFFNTAGDHSDAFAKFYDAYRKAMDQDEGDGDCSALAISPAYSLGIYAAENRLRTQGLTFPYFKVHTTGPCTFALTTEDEKKRAIYCNKDFRDVIVKALAMKCRWQIQKFQPFADNIICFIDEPILSTIRSATHVSVDKDDIVAHLSELIESIHMDDGLAGIHCCGSTDWSILVDAGIDILNVDAFGFGESITRYPEAIKKLMERGGAVAWGLVPTSNKIREQTVEGLVSLLSAIIDSLVEQGVDKEMLLYQSMITPSCGTGFMKADDAEKVFAMTSALSKYLRDHYDV